MSKFTNEYEVELLSVGPFEGIDNTTSAYYLEGGLGTDAINIVPDRVYQSYVSAQGRARFGTHPLNVLAGGVVQRGCLFKYGQSSSTIGQPITYYYLVICANGTMYYFQSTDTSATAVPFSSGLFVSTNYAQWVTYPINNPPHPSTSAVFFSDGENSPIQVDVTNTSYNWQISPPFTTLIPSNSGGGTGPSTTSVAPYYYRMTYSSATKESSPGPITAAFVANGTAVNFAGAPVSADPQVTSINVYRLGGTSGVWTLVVTGSNTATVGGIQDTTPDSALTGQSLVLHRDPPATFSAMEVHKDRIWGFAAPNSVYSYQYNSITNSYGSSSPDPSDLWYSNYGEPWGFDNTKQVLPMGRDPGGDYGVGLASLGSLLVAFKLKTTWAVYGDTQSDLLPRRLFDIGCVTKYSIVKAYGLVFWLSDRGFQSFDGGDAPVYLSRPIKSFLDGCSLSDLQACVGALHYRQILWSFPTIGVTWLFDIDTQKWFKLGWAANALVFDTNNNNEVTGAESNFGYVDSWFAAETDLGNAIVATFSSRIADSGQPVATKQYRNLLLQAPNQTGSVSVQLAVNPVSSNPITFTNSFALTNSQTRQVASVPPGCVGFEAQLIVTFTSNPSGPQQKTEVQRVSVTGYIKRRLNTAG